MIRSFGITFILFKYNWNLNKAADKRQLKKIKIFNLHKSLIYINYFHIEKKISKYAKIAK